MNKLVELTEAQLAMVSGGSHTFSQKNIAWSYQSASANGGNANGGDGNGNHAHGFIAGNGNGNAGDASATAGNINTTSQRNFSF